MIKALANDAKIGMTAAAILALIIAVLDSVIPWLFSFVPQDVRGQVEIDAFLVFVMFLCIGVRVWFKASVPPIKDTYNYKQEEQTWIEMTMLDQFRRKRD